MIDWSMGMINTASIGIFANIAAEYGHQSAHGYVFALFESAVAIILTIGK